MKIAGVDEVGRGCLAGPVFSAAVILNDNINTKNIKDSKKISFKNRILLCEYIKKNSIYAVGIASVSEIYKINILNASLLSMERALKKGEGNDPDSNYEEVRYEGYGPEGIAIIVEAMTNNKNRTAAEIRSIFSKSGGNLGESGSVSFGFKRLGAITLEKKIVSEEDLFDFVVENGSEDLETNDEEHIVYCENSLLHLLNEKIISKFGQTISADLIWRSANTIDVGKDTAEKLFKLLNSLEDNEDVQSVSSNFEISEDILTSLT